VGDATARTQYAKVSQVQDGGYVTLSSVSGSDTITATCAPAITAYAAGQFFTFVSAGANTGAATLNINSLGDKAITKEGTTALAAGDIASGAVVCVEYDGTRFQLVGGRSVQPLDAQLTTLAGITAQQAADLASLSTFMGTVLNDANGDAVFTTLGASDSSAQTGYQKLPSGVIIQWGLSLMSASALTTVTLPMGFTNSGASVVGTTYSGTAAFYGIQCGGLTTTNFSAGILNSTPAFQGLNLSWVAIGY